MSNLKNLEKLKRELGGKFIADHLEKSGDKKAFLEFIDALFRYNSRDAAWEYDYEGDDDVTDEEIDEGAAFHTLWDLERLGEYASRLMEDYL